jgi:hypothetical protein
MIRRTKIVIGVMSLGLATAAGYAIRAAASGVPASNALSYAGVLEDSNGPINGSHNILLILYDAATAGNNLCQSAPLSLNVQNGHFSVQLPEACTTAVGANPNVWIDVLVNGADTGRTKIGAVPYAVEANHAVNADNATNAMNATSATSANHASTADTATNATNATNATSAANASTAAALSSGARGGLSFFDVAGSTLSLGGTSGVCTVDSNQFSANCTCPSGTFVVSGGGWTNVSGDVIGESRPVSTTTWRTSCANNITMLSHACGGYELVCSRLGP